MFTGIVQEIGTIVRLVPRSGGKKVLLRAPKVASAAKAGDSVCVDGVCLTVTGVDGEKLEFDVGAETEKKTTVGSSRVGQEVNLEPAAAAGSPMGGHFVNGHVDGVGKVVSVRRRGETIYLGLQVPAEGVRHVAARGSIAVDGVSLTVGEVSGDEISIALIPYTLEKTTLGRLRIGRRVNVEFDILAKYAEASLSRERGLTLAALEEEGFE